MDADTELKRDEDVEPGGPPAPEELACCDYGGEAQGEGWIPLHAEAAGASLATEAQGEDDDEGVGQVATEEYHTAGVEVLEPVQDMAAPAEAAVAAEASLLGDTAQPAAAGGFQHPAPLSAGGPAGVEAEAGAGVAGTGADWDGQAEQLPQDGQVWLGEGAEQLDTMGGKGTAGGEVQTEDLGLSDDEQMPDAAGGPGAEQQGAGVAEEVGGYGAEDAPRVMDVGEMELVVGDEIHEVVVDAVDVGRLAVGGEAETAGAGGAGDMQVDVGVPGAVTDTHEDAAGEGGQARGADVQGMDAAGAGAGGEDEAGRLSGAGVAGAVVAGGSAEDEEMDAGAAVGPSKADEAEGVVVDGMGYALAPEARGAEEEDSATPCRGAGATASVPLGNNQGHHHGEDDEDRAAGGGDGAEGAAEDRPFGSDAGINMSPLLAAGPQDSMETDAPGGAALGSPSATTASAAGRDVDRAAAGKGGRSGGGAAREDSGEGRDGKRGERSASRDASGKRPADGDAANETDGNKKQRKESNGGLPPKGERRDSDGAKKEGNGPTPPKIRNFTVTLDLPSRSGHGAEVRNVGLIGPGAKWYKGGSGRRWVGSGPAVTSPQMLYRGSDRSKPGMGKDSREVAPSSGKDANWQVTVTVDDPSSIYLNTVQGRALPDPCVPPDIHYDEGLRRMDEFLDVSAMREIMSVHFEHRISPIIEFGRVNLQTLRNKQAWLLTSFRNQKGNTEHDVSFSRVYTLACARITALLGGKVTRQLLDLLPTRKKKYLVFTLGQADYSHLADRPEYFFRNLVHSFTPPDLIHQMWRIEPVPGPSPKGNISVKHALPPPASRDPPPRRDLSSGGGPSSSARGPLPPPPRGPSSPPSRGASVGGGGSTGRGDMRGPSQDRAAPSRAGPERAGPDRQDLDRSLPGRPGPPGMRTDPRGDPRDLNRGGRGPRVRDSRAPPLDEMGRPDMSRAEMGRDMGRDGGRQDMGRDSGRDMGGRDLGRDLGRDVGRHDMGRDGGRQDMGRDGGRQDMGRDSGRQDISRPRDSRAPPLPAPGDRSKPGAPPYRDGPQSGSMHRRDGPTPPRDSRAPSYDSRGSDTRNNLDNRGGSLGPGGSSRDGNLGPRDGNLGPPRGSAGPPPRFNDHGPKPPPGNPPPGYGASPPGPPGGNLGYQGQGSGGRQSGTYGDAPGGGGGGGRNSGKGSYLDSGPEPPRGGSGGRGYGGYDGPDQGRGPSGGGRGSGNRWEPAGGGGGNFGGEQPPVRGPQPPRGNPPPNRAPPGPGNPPGPPGLGGNYRGSQQQGGGGGMYQGGGGMGQQQQPLLPQQQHMDGGMAAQMPTNHAQALEMLGMPGGLQMLQQQLQQQQQQQQPAGVAVLAEVLSSLLGGALGNQVPAVQPQLPLQQQHSGGGLAGAIKPPVTDSAAAVAAALAFQQQQALLMQQQQQQQMQEMQAQMQAQIQMLKNQLQASGPVQQQQQQPVQQQQQQQQIPLQQQQNQMPMQPMQPKGPGGPIPPTGGIPGGPVPPGVGPASVPPMAAGMMPPIDGRMPPAVGPDIKHMLDQRQRRTGLQVRAAGSSTPARWRGALPKGANQATHQDARCIGSYAMAVADGLSATRQLGIDSGPWAQALAEACVRAAEEALAHAEKTGTEVASPSEILAKAVTRVPGSGAASVCLMFIDRAELRMGSVGSCGGIALRAHAQEAEMRPVTKWQPFADPKSRNAHLASVDLAPLVGAHAPSPAGDERVSLMPGDILVLGSHGLFDMVWFHSTPSTNLRRELYALGHTQQVEPQMIANQLTSLAANMGETAGLAGSPLSQQLAKEGRTPMAMNDVGDNTAVLAYVLQRTS